MAGHSSTSPPNREAPLTPAQAVTALNDLQGFQQRLSARVGALTGMVWGIASAAIFVSYGLAVSTPGFPRILFPYLWAPWTLAGFLTTGAAWRLHALSLRRPYDRARGRRFGIGFTALFGLAILALVFLKPGIDPFVLMTLVNALVLVVIGTFVARNHNLPAAAPLFVGAAFIALAALVLANLHLAAAALAFASAATVATGFIGAGVAGFMRG